MGKITKLTIQYRGGSLPEHLGTLLANADETDLRILVALQMLADKESGIAPTGELASLLGISESEVSASLKFWRGAGVLSAVSAPKPKKEAETLTETVPAAATATAHRGGAVEQSGNLPQYSSSELAELMEQRTSLVGFIDEAQRVLGKMLRTYDAGILVGIVDQYGFEEAAVLAILAYMVQKGKKTVRYAEQIALRFYDEGITDTDAVLERLHRMEQSGETVQKIRVLFGAAGRELTTTEKRLFSSWCEKLGYDVEVIRMAYDITVDTIQKPAPKYTNSILEAWHAKGLRTAEEVRQHLDAEKKEKAGTSVGGVAKSYDLDEFIEAALKRSYEEML